MSQIAKKKVLLTAVIEGKTALFQGKDFMLIEVHHPAPTRKKVEEWTIVKFLQTKNNKDGAAKKAMVQDQLTALNIETQEYHGTKGQKQFYVKLPELNSAPQLVKAGIRIPTDFNDPLDEQKKKLNLLKQAHQDFKILGAANKDQPDLKTGLVHFNYLNEAEMERAMEIFTKKKVEFILRDGKKCNLTFDLGFKKIKVSDKEKVTQRQYTSVIDACCFILRKVYRKILAGIPDDGPFGVSKRVICPTCSETEMLLVKKELKEKYGIYLIIESGDARHSHFFILTSEVAVQLYRESGERIPVKELLHKMENPGQRTLSSPSVGSPEIQSLSRMLRGLIKKEKIKILGERGVKKGEIYMMVKKVSPKKAQISVVNGTEDEKIALIKQLKDVIEIKFGAKAKIKAGAKKQTRFTVRVAGFVNTPPKKRTRTSAIEPVAAPLKEKVSTPAKAKSFFDFLSTEQKEILEKEFSNGKPTKATIIGELSNHFFFVSKKHPMVKALLPEVFASTDEVLKVVKE